MVTEISSQVRARRWLRYAAWPLYLWAIIAGLLSLLFLAISPKYIVWSALIASALALLGYTIEKGSRIGAIVVFVLVGGLQLRPPELGGLTLLFGLLSWGTALGAIVATFAWAQSRGDRPAVPGLGVGEWVRRLLIHLQSPHPWLAVGHLLLIGLSLGFTVGGIFLLFGGSPETWTYVAWRFALLLPLVVLGGSAMAYGWRAAKRYAAVPASVALAHDQRPPVLFLRSFADDLSPIERRPTLNVSLSRYDRQALTLEEVVERALWLAGPVIGIGRPDETLPPAGAAREYVAGGEWQRRVTNLISSCRYVAVVVGSGAGLAWECRAIAEGGTLAKVILVFPATPAAFWPATAAALSVEASPLPPGVLVARFPEGPGAPWFITSRWHDEDGYELAIAEALSTRVGDTGR